MNISHGQEAAEVDVLIVGSGPAGATFARTIADAHPAARILMVDAGPQLSDRPGMNVRNIADPVQRSQAQLASQGPTPFPYEVGEHAPQVSRAQIEALAALARPGTYLIHPEPEQDADLPGAAASTNVGGMGAHWTCACPRPAGSERVSFIAEAEMDRAFSRAETLLHVSGDSFAPSRASQRITQALSETFNSAEQRPVGSMPLACTRLRSGEREWTGSDTILGEWAGRLDARDSPVRLQSETLCRRLILSEDHVTGATLEHLPSKRHQEVHAKFVVVAADSLRSPQLLWASGLRPQALGHYLNEHPQILSTVMYTPAAEELVESPDASEFGVFWVPFAEPEHCFHGQIMSLAVSPLPLADGSPSSALTLALCWFCRKDIRYEDTIEFSAETLDFYGMPAMKMHYGYTERDLENFASAERAQSRAAACIGEFIERPSLLRAGRSLHYQGTMRMGAADDGTSVCDPDSRVWGMRNLFLGGNGVIPTATACNPTLTTVALAVLAAEQLAALLGAAKIKSRKQL